MMAINRRISSFVPLVELDGQIDRGKLEAACRHGFCITRWRVDETRP
jgi:hypothetical protein